MKKSLIAAVAAFGMMGGAALASEHHLWLDDVEAQARVHDWATAQGMAAWTAPTGWVAGVGEPLPPEAETHAFTGFEAYPEAAGFEYVTVNGNTVVVDAETREIVAVID